MQRAAEETLEPHFRAFEKLVGLDPNRPPPAKRYAIVDPATILAATRQPRKTPSTKQLRKPIKNKPAKKKTTKSSRPASKR
jgi:hypothetical protein